MLSMETRSLIPPSHVRARRGIPPSHVRMGVQNRRIRVPAEVGDVGCRGDRGRIVAQEAGGRRGCKLSTSVWGILAKKSVSNNVLQDVDIRVVERLFFSCDLVGMHLERGGS